MAVGASATTVRARARTRPRMTSRIIFRLENHGNGVAAVSAQCAADTSTSGYNTRPSTCRRQFQRCTSPRTEGTCACSCVAKNGDKSAAGAARVPVHRTATVVKSQGRADAKARPPRARLNIFSRRPRARKGSEATSPRAGNAPFAFPAACLSIDRSHDRFSRIMFAALDDRRVGGSGAFRERWLNAREEGAFPGEKRYRRRPYPLTFDLSRESAITETLIDTLARVS